MENYLGKTIEKLLIAKNGGNQSELARAVGVSPQAVQQWIAGKTQPRRAKLREVARFFKVDLSELEVDPDEFLAIAAEFSMIEEEPIRNTINEMESASGESTTAPNDRCIWMDQYDYRFSAGTGHIQWDIREKHAFPFPAGFFKALGVRPLDCRLARIPGRSMEPYLFNRDLMMICEGNKHVRDGQIYAIYFENEVLVKQIFKEPDGALRLHSYNPEFSDRIVGGEQLAGLQIVGEVVFRLGSGLAGSN